MDLLNSPTPPAVPLNKIVDRRLGETRLTERKDGTHSLDRRHADADQEGGGTYHADRDENDTLA